MNERPTRREWIMALVIALVATGIMQVPYLLGYALARPGTEFTGILINVEDYSYQEIMLQGYDGAWQFHIQYTSEEHTPAFLYVPYLALGHLARLLGMSVVGMWHLSRIVASLALVLAAFAFIAAFLRDRTERWVAFFLAIFGAGFDWSLFPWETFNIVGGAPIEFRMPEAHLFFSALTYPHFSLGVVLMLAAFHFSLRAFDQSDWRFALGAGGANALLVLTYPFLIFLVGSVLGVYWLVLSWSARRILWHEAVMLVIAFAVPAPLVAYYAYVLQVNDVFRAWNSQVATLSPGPLHYALAYGIMIVLGIIGWRFGPIAKQGNEGREPTLVGRVVLLWVWVVVVIALLYAPLNMQRRFVEGVQVPLAILASIGLVRVVIPWVRQTRRFGRIARWRHYTLDGLAHLSIVVFLLLMSASNLVIVTKLSLQSAVVQTEAFFRTHAEVQAVDWLRAHVSKSDVVLADYWTAGLIPARAGTAVFVGQRYETIGFDQKLEQVALFYGNSVNDGWRCDLLNRYRVRYVWWGPREQRLGAFDPASASYLSQVYSDSGVALFKYTGTD